MRKTTLHFFLSCALLLSVFSVDAQNLRFKQWTIDHNLPSNHIHQTQIDELGYLWIETDEGLSRFDGTAVQHTDWMDIPLVAHLDSILIPISIIDNKLYGSKNGVLYALEVSCINHRSKEIVRTEDAIFIHHKNTLNESELIIINKDSCYIMNHNPNDSLFYHKSSSSILSLPSEKTAIPFQLGNYSKDKIIVNIPKKGVFETTLLENHSLQYVAIDSQIIASQLGIQSISPNGGIWLIEDNMLTKWGKTFEPLLHSLKKDIPNVSHIRSNDFNVFFTDGKRLFIYDLGSDALNDITDYLNINSTVHHLELDKEDNLWVSTEGNGLFCVYHSLFTGYNIGILGQTSINHLYATQSLGLLAGTDDGLYLISSSWSKIPLNPTLGKIKVFHIGEDDNDVIYASTNHGIFSITQGNPKNCFPSEKNIQSFLIDDTGHLSFSRDGVLYAYKNCGTQPSAWPMTATKSSNVLFQDDSNRVWMGTNEGLVIYEKGGIEPKLISEKDGLPHSKINDIILRGKNMYIATDGGLSIINTVTFDIENFTNLPSLKCRKIAITKNEKIWIYSPNGIFSFFPNNEENAEKLGIPMDGVRSLKIDNKDKLWIGTTKGLLSFNTNNAFQEEDAPLLSWNEILLNNEKISVDSNEITLSQRGILHVEYGAIVYRDARLASYQYRMNPTDKWLNTQNRNLTFSNLKAGDYILQIRVQKPNSAWSKPLSLAFRVQPPLWRRTGFLALLGLGLTMFIGLIFYSIRAREKKRIERQRRFAELELKALQSQMDPHFLFNTLSAIQHAIMKGNTADASKSLNNFASLMRLFLESSKQKYIPLGDEVKMLQLYCELTKNCYEDKFDYTIKVDPKIDLDDMEIPSVLIQPHVENAIRHGLLPGKQKGSLDIDFSLQKKNLICTIKDDGIGRAKAAEIKKNSNQSHTSIGTKLTAERASMLNKIYHSDIKIKITDLKGRRGAPLGTDVKIIIPME
jgi:ligand-binding sensor domain-containing protein